MSMGSKSITVSVTHNIYGGVETEDIKINKTQFDALILKPFEERDDLEDELLRHIHENKGLSTQLLSQSVKSHLDNVNAKITKDYEGTDLETFFKLFDERDEPESEPWGSKLKKYLGLGNHEKKSNGSGEVELLRYMQDKLKNEFAPSNLIENAKKTLVEKLLQGKKANKSFPLKKNERLILELMDIEYLEHRSTGIEGSHAGVSYKVSKNVTLRTGRFKGSSTSALSVIDKGKLTITNLRIVFSGRNNIKEIPYSKILMLEIKKDDIIISIKGKQKKETYRGFLDFEPITVNIPKRKGDARGYPPYKWSLTADNLKLIISKLRAEKLPASISTSVSEDSSIIELVKCGPKAAGVIKAIREALDLGLKEAHDIVKSAPVDLPGPLTKTQGVLLHQTLEELGATVNLK